MIILRNIGLAGILIGCGTSETQNSSIAEPEVLPQEKAGEILSQLQESVSQDLPQRVHEQEKAIADIETQVLQPWKLAFLSKDDDAFGKLLAPDAKIAKLVGTETATSIRNEGGILEYVAQPEEVASQVT